ncbi:MAG: RNA methyltransferase [Bacteroidetes bacterium]|nr:RNA methyltransferase [Bacteroidota bacterium]
MKKSETGQYSSALYEYLSGFLTEERRKKFEKHIALRSRYVTIVVEDIFQPHNASAVLRSAECFGLQDVHIIESKNKYNPNPDVVMGANKWLTLHHHSGKENNTDECISFLKKNKYRIVATTPHKNDQLISQLDLSKGKVALFFGTELEGISKNIMDAADEFVKIPMFGFTESFNISVSAAICMYELMTKLRTSNIDWQLSEEEKNNILLDWARNSIKKPELLEEEFRKKLTQ